MAKLVRAIKGSAIWVSKNRPLFFCKLFHTSSSTNCSKIVHLNINEPRREAATTMSAAQYSFMFNLFGLNRILLYNAPRLCQLFFIKCACSSQQRHQHFCVRFNWINKSCQTAHYLNMFVERYYIIPQRCQLQFPAFPCCCSQLAFEFSIWNKSSDANYSGF